MQHCRLAGVAHRLVRLRASAVARASSGSSVATGKSSPSAHDAQRKVFLADRDPDGDVTDGDVTDGGDRSAAGGSGRGGGGDDYGGAGVPPPPQTSRRAAAAAARAARTASIAKLVRRPSSLAALGVRVELAGLLSSGSLSLWPAEAEAEALRRWHARPW